MSLFGVGAYYNEYDPYAAAWLKNLIAAGHIAPGDVDTRSILDVSPEDLRGYTQCHFFAGVGVWSLALRRAGWSDDRPIWTGSCPCQPFSVAGMGAGFDDQRHLWPYFHYLINVCNPPVVAGEQVASKNADTWIDLVQTDLEGLGYAVGAIAFPSAGVGAPHIRDRTYWAGLLGDAQPGGMGYANVAGLEGQRGGYQAAGWEPGSVRPAAATGESGGLADAGAQRHDGSGAAGTKDGTRGGWPATTGRRDATSCGQSGPTNGYWRDADWLGCRDGKWRPVEPGTFPLAHGAASRVGRLRAYGNAVNAYAAQAFIESLMECMP